MTPATIIRIRIRIDGGLLDDDEDNGNGNGNDDGGGGGPSTDDDCRSISGISFTVRYRIIKLAGGESTKADTGPEMFCPSLCSLPVT